MKRQKAGFTIVETLIVLGVSSLLFLSVAALINGQLNRYRTRDAVFNLESQVRDVINDVATGYYPEVSGATPDCLGTAGGSADRGTNTNCVIAGKSITFGSNNMTINTIVSDTNGVSKHIAVGLSETKNYQWGITPTSNSANKTFYILNKNYKIANTANASGGQSVGIYDSSYTSLGVAGSVICFVNGNHDSSITLGKDGGLTVGAEINSICT